MIVRWRRSIAAALPLAFGLSSASCGGALEPVALPPPAPAVVAVPEGSLGRIERRQLDARPRLTLVSREGDPSPALVISVATDLGPAPTTVVAAILEARLRAAGFEVDSRADHSALRVRLLLTDAGRAGPFFEALAAAAQRPLVAGGPEIALAIQRLQALRRNPLDAVELAPVVGCTGALGVAPGEALPDLATPRGVSDAEGWRAGALVSGRASIAAVGPSAFVAAIGGALASSPAWPAGAAANDPWPAADAVGVYTSPLLDRRSARLTVALRTGEPGAAAAAAERLAAPDSPLITRLRGLAQPWRVTEVIGTARPRGGCVAVTIETAMHPRDVAMESTAALAGALARAELRAEIAVSGGASVAGRQILTAADPREAAARAAWWALSGVAPGATERWAFALALPPIDHPARAERTPQRFQSELDRAVAAGARPVVERAGAVERGQGELWMLLASPCGVAEEGVLDPGFGAIAALASIEATRARVPVTLEPWITSDGIGVLAHAPLRDERDTPLDLARRVGDAAARALVGSPLSVELTTVARASALDFLARAGGREATTFAAFAGALSPDHPSWIEPFGLWNKVASAGLEDLRFRRSALAGGPLRVAVLGNADAAEVEAAGQAVERWFSPSLDPRLCRAGSPSPAKPGRYEVRPPDGAPGRALIGAPIPAPNAAGHDLALLSALALDGEGGLLAASFQQAVGSATARVAGGSRVPTLVIEIHAPAAGVSAALTEVKLALARVAETVSEADLERAFSALARREQEGRADPRRRVIDLWSARKATALVKPAIAAWKAFLGATFKEASLVVVEAKAD